MIEKNQRFIFNQTTISLSHKATLKRGFAIVRKENKIVKSAKVLKDDEKFK